MKTRGPGQTAGAFFIAPGNPFAPDRALAYHGPVRRAAPYLLFAALTAAVLWRYPVLGHTIYRVEALEIHLGVHRDSGSRWFRADPVHGGVIDNILLLPVNLRIYNEGLKRGELRLWNPHLFCGYPVYSDPMVHPFYPPHLVLHTIFGPEAAYHASLMLHLFFSGAAMFWALGAMGRGRAASTLGGAVWMLLGYNALWFSTATLLGVSVFGPLAFMALRRGLQRRELSTGGLAGAAMGMAILGSHPQHALNFFVFLLIWLAAAALRDRDSRGFAARTAIIFSVSSVGAGLAAILTRLETIEAGSRGPSPEFDVLYGNHWAALGYAAGLVLGKACFPATAHLEFEFTVYAGLGASCLSVLGAARGLKDPDFRFFPPAAVALLAVAFAAPVARIFELIPIMNLSPPTRWIFVFGFCLAALAARGWDELPSAPRWIPVVPSAATLLLALVTAAGAGPLQFSNGATVETLIGFALVTLAAFAARRRPRYAPALAGIALAFELLPFFIQFNPLRDPEVMRRAPEAILFARNRGGEPWRATGALGSAYSSADALCLPEVTIGNNSLALFGLENVAGFEAVIPSHYARFCAEAGATLLPGGRTILFQDFSSPLLDMAGLRYIFMPFAMKPPERFRPAGEWGRLRLYENHDAYPRAWMVAGAIAARDEDEAAMILRNTSFRPREAAVINAERPIGPSEPGPVNCRIVWKERTPDRLKLEVDAEAPGLLVLSETDYPGWEAAVDGASTTIYRANLAFRAVALPAGRHDVEFVFRPASVRRGLWGSAGFFALAVAFAALRRRACCRRDESV